MSRRPRKNGRNAGLTVLCLSSAHLPVCQPPACLLFPCHLHTHPSSTPSDHPPACRSYKEPTDHMTTGLAIEDTQPAGPRRAEGAAPGDRCRGPCPSSAARLRPSLELRRVGLRLVGQGPPARWLHSAPHPQLQPPIPSQTSQARPERRLTEGLGPAASPVTPESTLTEWVSLGAIIPPARGEGTSVRKRPSWVDRLRGQGPQSSGGGPTLAVAEGPRCPSLPGRSKSQPRASGHLLLVPPGRWGLSSLKLESLLLMTYGDKGHSD